MIIELNEEEIMHIKNILEYLYGKSDVYQYIEEYLTLEAIVKKYERDGNNG